MSTKTDQAEGRQLVKGHFVKGIFVWVGLGPVERRFGDVILLMGIEELTKPRGEDSPAVVSVAEPYYLVVA